MELAVKLNHEAINYVCAICGDERSSAHNLELFTADTWELVCFECGREHAPLLATLIDLANAAESFAVQVSILPHVGEEQISAPDEIHGE